jgi:hypothetical protein
MPNLILFECRNYTKFGTFGTVPNLDITHH